ncbi:MAG: glycosyltransferase family protein, partial [Kiloniellales bacterium]
MTGRPRIFLYVQHLLGIGHQTRAATLARALQRAGFAVDFVAGGFPVPGLELGGARVHQLPPLRATDIYFKVLVDEQGRQADEAFKAARRDRLLALFAARDPDILLTEMFPFGRRQMRFELLPLLDAARARRRPPLIASSVRDILVASPKPQRVTEMLGWVERYYDLVLVHGDPAFVPFERTFAPAAEIAGKLRYSGYVIDERATATAAPNPEGQDCVIVSTGGGAVSEPLLEAALAARALTPLKDRHWRLLVGHNLPEARFAGLGARAPRGVTVERSRSDFVQLLKGAALSISQAGYNTLLEVMGAKCPCLVVPYAGGLETEQTLRARLLEERGLLAIVKEQDLSAERLAEGVERALAAAGTAQRLELDVGGGPRSAALLS